jgi:membrane fusion protein, multidrug efflux system
LPNQLTVPNVAIQDGQQGQFVYVVNNDTRQGGEDIGTVHLKTVQVGVTTETVSQILSGLNDGDRVVVDGTDRLEEGANVRVRKPGELENPPGYDPGAFAGKGGGKGKKGFKKGGGNFKKGQGGGQGQ